MFIAYQAWKILLPNAKAKTPSVTYYIEQHIQVTCDKQ